MRVGIDEIEIRVRRRHSPVYLVLGGLFVALIGVMTVTYDPLIMAPFLLFFGGAWLLLVVLPFIPVRIRITPSRLQIGGRHWHWADIRGVTLTDERIEVRSDVSIFVVAHGRLTWAEGELAEATRLVHQALAEHDPDERAVDPDLQRLRDGRTRDRAR